MSESYIYSAKTGGFCPASWKALYQNTPDGWPDDGVEINASEYDALFKGQSEGKIITSDDSGYPILIDVQEPTHEENVVIAEALRDKLMKDAAAKIAPLQDAADIDDATDEERASLKDWKKYRIALNRLDLSAAPDITWPESPA